MLGLSSHETVGPLSGHLQTTVGPGSAPQRGVGGLSPLFLALQPSGPTSVVLVWPFGNAFTFYYPFFTDLEVTRHEFSQYASI